MRNIVVSIFLAYLRTAARLQIFKIKPKHIVGITGSAGKSSCREAVYTVLSLKYKVKRSSGGNSETGLPLDILGFTGEFDYTTLFWLKVLLLTPIKLLFNWEKYDVYVAEMGIDSPNEPRNMSYLLKIVKPDVGVFLNALPTHTQYFPQNEISELTKAVANEKGKLIAQLPKNGFAILNADDSNVVNTKTSAQIITFGTDSKSDIKPYFPKSQKFFFTKDYGMTFAAAIAVGQALKIGPDESKKVLDEKIVLPAGRASIFKGIKNTTILDSTYNASRQTMIACLDYLKNFKAPRKIAVLGDMRELGIIAKEEHEKVARIALESADHIFTFGPLMQEYFKPKTEKVKSFTNMSKLVQSVQDFIKPGDVILVKGSQNTIFLEILVEQLLANKEDTQNLCRRGAFWDDKRNTLLCG